LERWQADRLNRARKDLDDFIAKGRADMERLQRQIREAERIRRSFTRIEDFR